MSAVAMFAPTVPLRLYSATSIEYLAAFILPMNFCEMSVVTALPPNATELSVG